MRQSHLQPVPESVAPAPENCPEGDPHLIPVQHLRQLARQQAADWPPHGPHSGSDSNIQARGKEAAQILSACLKPPAEVTPDWQWLHENRRLLRTAQVESKDALKLSRKHPHVALEKLGMVPRAYAVASGFLDAVQDEFSEPALQVYLTALQEVRQLEMGEIWALKPMLQLVLLERVASSALAKAAPALARQINSLRDVGRAQWKDLFEAVNAVDGVLEEDPAQAYHRMDYESRDLYRKAIARLAAKSSMSETEVAQAAVNLARVAAQRLPTTDRRTHVGFYLLDQGLATLQTGVGYKLPFPEQLRIHMVLNPNGFYLVGIEVTTFIIVAFLLSGLHVLTPVLAGLLMLLLPATQAAVEFMNSVVSWIIPPHRLPRLDFSEGIPADCATMVAVPTLLLNEKQVRGLVSDLEVRYLANSHDNLYFALLTDVPDSHAPVDEKDDLIHLCRALVEGLNGRYGADGATPFYLFHRNRMFNEAEGAWMGWERKRGKLLDLNRFLRGSSDPFAVKVGSLGVLPSIRYVITLDSDTQLPRETAFKLIGTMAHPLNKAVVDAATKMVVQGYGILQPRVGVSIQSASASRLASIYSGQTGFDIYTRAVSDVYQDLYGEGSFTGKGIYDVDALRETLEHRFPVNALLSHDLIEGAYARAGLVSDLELVDDYPSHFSAFSRRRHRWVRGDWQVMRWLLPTVPNFTNRLIPNPISLVSRWKILDNLRRSLFDPATLLLMLAGWFYLPGGPRYWTIASLALLLLPVYSQLFFALLRGVWKPATLRDALFAFAKGHFTVLLQVVFLLHQALLSIDAIVRSMVRTTITGKKLLEWETAAEAESSTRRRTPVDKYLDLSPWLSMGIGFTLWAVRPEALTVAAPILLCWFSARLISDWLNRSPRPQNRALHSAEREVLQLWASRTWRYFCDFCNEDTSWLIPDNIRESELAQAARLSPTNLGVLLNSRIAAVHFGYLNLDQFVDLTQKTLNAAERLPRYRGHFLNWYDTSTLEALNPQFVSTVDSGNLAVCLWTLKQAALTWAEQPESPRDALQQIAATCERLVEDMDFAFLYHPKKKVLSVGFDATAKHLEPSGYDLLASESRMAAFVAIAKGDIPQEAWFHLGRKHTLYRGEKVLISWTGTMFEYLLPALWMHHHPDTLLERTNRAAVRVQKHEARKHKTPWGVSEAAFGHPEDGSEYLYAPFGIPALALKGQAPANHVVSPYSSFLALSVEPRAAYRNLRHMEKLGWLGDYGFYESFDGELIRCWMTHHQGMSLLAICNLLYDCPFQRYFHSEPRVIATELLLHERVPSTMPVDKAEKDTVVLPGPQPALKDLHPHQPLADY